MIKFSLVEFSMRRPKLIVAATVVLTLLFVTQFPRIKTDTNPKHMLPETSDVRVWNNDLDAQKLVRRKTDSHVFANSHGHSVGAAAIRGSRKTRG